MDILYSRTLIMFLGVKIQAPTLPSGLVGRWEVSCLSSDFLQEAVTLGRALWCYGSHGNQTQTEA